MNLKEYIKPSMVHHHTHTTLRKQHSRVAPKALCPFKRLKKQTNENNSFTELITSPTHECSQHIHNERRSSESACFYCSSSQINPPTFTTPSTSPRQAPSLVWWSKTAQQRTSLSSKYSFASWLTFSAPSAAKAGSTAMFLTVCIRAKKQGERPSA